MKKKIIAAIGVIILLIALLNGKSVKNSVNKDFRTSAKSSSTEKQITPEKQTTNENIDKKSTQDKAEVLTNGRLKIHYINVGQADSILIQQGNHAMLIDGGNNADGGAVKNYITKEGVTNLEYVVGTHPHEDHIGGLDYVINNLKVGKVYLPKTTSTTRTYKDLIQAISNKGLKINTPAVGENFKLGDAICTILAPNSSTYKDLNNYSIVIKISFGNTTFMFNGDAEELSEKEMLANGTDLKADVLKIGHHGSNSSSSEEFLNAVNPKYAIISVGKMNDYGHPHKGTMERLKAKGISVYRTDECDTVVATSDGKNINFSTNPGDYNYNGLGKSAKQSEAPEYKTLTPSGGDNKTVYWTPNGKSYHYKKECTTLKKSKTVLEGALSQCPKKDPCNKCVY